MKRIKSGVILLLSLLLLSFSVIVYCETTGVKPNSGITESGNNNTGEAVGGDGANVEDSSHHGSSASIGEQGCYGSAIVYSISVFDNGIDNEVPNRRRVTTSVPDGEIVYVTPHKNVSPVLDSGVTGKYYYCDAPFADEVYVYNGTTRGTAPLHSTADMIAEFTPYGIYDNNFAMGGSFDEAASNRNNMIALTKHMVDNYGGTSVDIEDAVILVEQYSVWFLSGGDGKCVLVSGQEALGGGLKSFHEPSSCNFEKSEFCGIFDEFDDIFTIRFVNGITNLKNAFTLKQSELGTYGVLRGICMENSGYSIYGLSRLGDASETITGNITIKYTGEHGLNGLSDDFSYTTSLLKSTGLQEPRGTSYSNMSIYNGSKWLNSNNRESYLKLHYSDVKDYELKFSNILYTKFDDSDLGESEEDTTVSTSLLYRAINNFSKAPIMLDWKEFEPSDFGYSNTTPKVGVAFGLDRLNGTEDLSVIADRICNASYDWLTYYHGRSVFDYSDDIDITPSTNILDNINYALGYAFNMSYLNYYKDSLSPGTPFAFSAQLLVPNKPVESKLVIFSVDDESDSCTVSEKTFNYTASTFEEVPLGANLVAYIVVPNTTANANAQGSIQGSLKTVDSADSAYSVLHSKTSTPRAGGTGVPSSIILGSEVIDDKTTGYIVYAVELDEKDYDLSGEIYLDSHLLNDYFDDVISTSYNIKNGGSLGIYINEVDKYQLPEVYKDSCTVGSFSCYDVSKWVHEIKDYYDVEYSSTTEGKASDYSRTLTDRYYLKRGGSNKDDIIHSEMIDSWSVYIDTKNYGSRSTKVDYAFNFIRASVGDVRTVSGITYNSKSSADGDDLLKLDFGVKPKEGNMVTVAERNNKALIGTPATEKLTFTGRYAQIDTDKGELLMQARLVHHYKCDNKHCYDGHDCTDDSCTVVGYDYCDDSHSCDGSCNPLGICGGHDCDDPECEPQYGRCSSKHFCDGCQDCRGGHPCGGHLEWVHATDTFCKAYSLVVDGNPSKTNSVEYSFDAFAYKYQTGAMPNGANTSTGLRGVVKATSGVVNYSHGYVVSHDDLINKYYPEVDMAARFMGTEFDGNTNYTPITVMGDKERATFSSSLYGYRVLSNGTPITGTVYSDSMQGGSSVLGLNSDVIIPAGADVTLVAKPSSITLNLFGYSLDTIRSGDSQYNSVVKSGADINAEWGNADNRGALFSNFSEWSNKLVDVNNYSADVTLTVNHSPAKVYNNFSAVLGGINSTSPVEDGVFQIVIDGGALNSSLGDYSSLIATMASDFGISTAQADSLFRGSGIYQSILASIEHSEASVNNSTGVSIGGVTLGGSNWYDESVQTFVIRRYTRLGNTFRDVTLEDKIDYGAAASALGSSYNTTGNATGAGVSASWTLDLFFATDVDGVGNLYNPAAAVAGTPNAKSGSIDGYSMIFCDIPVTGAEFRIPNSTTADFGY